MRPSLLCALLAVAALSAASPDFTVVETVTPWTWAPTYPDRSLVAAGESTIYEVGPGKTYATPATVPWQNLLPGDQVLIYYQAEPYRTQLFLGCRGRAGKWITIRGVPGPNGERPILDASGSTAPPASSLFKAGLDGLGMIIIFTPTGSGPGYKPGYINIDGLEIRNTKPGNARTTFAGAASTWGTFTSGIWTKGVEHLAITNCDFHDNCLGLFVNSTDGTSYQSRDILVRGNYFHNNSEVGSYSEHNAYTEAIGTVYENNYFGPIISGSYGDNIKERSAGIIFRNNYIDGGANCISLRDPEASRDNVLPMADSYGDLLVANAFIYNNFFHQTEVLIGHGDGDYGAQQQVRRGPIHFYGNRVLATNALTSGYPVGLALFAMLNYNRTSPVTALNNLFYSASTASGAPALPFEIFWWGGQAAFQSNWISSYNLHDPNYGNYHSTTSAPNMWAGTAFDGSGLGGLTASTADPGFVNLAGGDYNLKPTSPFFSLAAALPTAVTTRGLAPSGSPAMTIPVNTPSNTAPVVSAATATPATVAATTSAIAATASDDAGEAALTYTWSASPATATFSPNGTNAAKAATATFTAAGSYTLTVTVRDAGGLSATRAVPVTVAQTPTTVTVTPAAVTLASGASTTLAAAVKDQFGAAMAAPTVAWTVTSGSGSVTAGGVYTAPAAAGTATVQAASGTVSAEATIQINRSSTGSDSTSGGCGAGAGGSALLLAAGTLCLGGRRRRRH